MGTNFYMFTKNMKLAHESFAHKEDWGYSEKEYELNENNIRQAIVDYAYYILNYKKNDIKYVEPGANTTIDHNKIYEGKSTGLLQEKLITGKEYTYKIRSYILVSGEKNYSSFKEIVFLLVFL